MEVTFIEIIICMFYFRITDWLLAEEENKGQKTTVTTAYGADCTSVLCLWGIPTSGWKCCESKSIVSVSIYTLGLTGTVDIILQIYILSNKFVKSK